MRNAHVIGFVRRINKQLTEIEPLKYLIEPLKYSMFKLHGNITYHVLCQDHRLADLELDSGDDDLQVGAFKRKCHKGDKDKASHHSGRLSDLTSTTATEDVLKEFLSPHFDNYFTNKTDVSLYVKMASADGLEP